MDYFVESSTDNSQPFIRYEFQVTKTVTIDGGGVYLDFMSHPSMQANFPAPAEEANEVKLKVVDGEVRQLVEAVPPGLKPLTEESGLAQVE